jgi:hypothetical protein
MLFVVGIIRLLPLSGALSGERLTALYGIAFDEPNVAILMRHRAVLLGLLGGALIVAALKPAYHAMAYVVGVISVVSFLYLAWATGDYNERVGRVFTADLVALCCLALGAASRLLSDP